MIVRRIKYLLNQAGFQGYFLFGLLFFLPLAALFVSKETNLYPVAVISGYCMALLTSKLIITYYKNSIKLFNTIVVMGAFYTVYASLTGKNPLKDMIYQNNNFFYVIFTILAIFGYILLGKIILLSAEGLKSADLK